MGRRPYAAVLVAIASALALATTRVQRRQRLGRPAQRADGHDRVEAVRDDRVRFAVGAARLLRIRTARTSRWRSPACPPRASASACCSRTRAARAARASTSCATRPTSSRPRSATRSTSSPGTRVASAGARRCGASTISTRSTRSTTIRSTPDAVAQNVSASRRRFVAACETNSASLLPYVSTEATGRDLDAIRAAIGVPRSATSASRTARCSARCTPTCFPTRVRAMVLDGAVDPARSYAETTIDQAKSFDADLDAFFAHCRSDSSCAFARGADPAAAYDDLARTISEEPIPGDRRRRAPHARSGRARHRGRERARTRAPTATTTSPPRSRRPGPDAATRCSRSPTPTPAGRTGGKYSNETAALYAIGCIDAPCADDASAAVQQLAARAARVAPHFGASTVWLGLPCTFWPVPVAREGRADPRAGRAADRRRRHHARSRRRRTRGRQSLASRAPVGPPAHRPTATSHTSYGRGDQCVDGAVDRYLLAPRGAGGRDPLRLNARRATPGPVDGGSGDVERQHADRVAAHDLVDRLVGAGPAPSTSGDLLACRATSSRCAGSRSRR